MSDSLPETGYGDYRRTDEMAPDVVLDVTGADSVPDPTYGRFFIGQAPSLEVRFIPSAAPQDLQIQFFSQETLGPVLAATRYAVDTANTLRMIVPCFAQWVSLGILHPFGGAVGTHDLFAQTSRRIGYYGPVMLNTQPLHTGAVNVGAGASVTVLANAPYFGPLYVFTETDATAFRMDFTGLNRDNVETFLHRVIPEDGKTTHLAIAIPCLRFRVKFINDDAAAKTFLAECTPQFM